MATTTKFTNRKTGRQFQIYHTVNCKSFYVIYLIECTLCLFKPYIGKCETTFNLRLNTHRTHAKYDNSILVDTHFKSAGHDFTKHARVTIIEKLENTYVKRTNNQDTRKKRRLLDDQTRHTNSFWFQHFPQQPLQIMPGFRIIRSTSRKLNTNEKAYNIAMSINMTSNNH